MDANTDDTVECNKSVYVSVKCFFKIRIYFTASHTRVGALAAGTSSVNFLALKF